MPLAIGTAVTGAFEIVGAALVVLGGVFAVIALLNKWDLPYPIGVIFLAFGSVLGLVRTFEAHHVVWWIVFVSICFAAAIAAVSFLAAALFPSLRLHRPFLFFQLPPAGDGKKQGNDDQDGPAQINRKGRRDVNQQRHEANVPPGVDREAGFMLIAAFAAGALLGGLVKRK